MTVSPHSLSDPPSLRFPLEGGRAIELTLPGEWTRGEPTVPEHTRSYGRAGFLERWCIVEPGE